MDGRIDDASTGWKGRGLFSTYSERVRQPHIEGGKGQTSKVVHFQIDPIRWRSKPVQNGTDGRIPRWIRPFLCAEKSRIIEISYGSIEMIGSSRLLSQRCCLPNPGDRANAAAFGCAESHHQREVQGCGRICGATTDRIVQETISLDRDSGASLSRKRQGARLSCARCGQYGLADVHIDQEGNVIGSRKKRAGGRCSSSAPISTPSSPEGTAVKVKREGNRLFAPGVGDDTRGLAVMLAVIRAFDAAKVETASDILFVASVGERRLGRSARHEISFS